MSVAWPPEHLVMDRGQVTREHRVTLWHGALRLRYRPAEDAYWLDGLVITRDLLGRVTSERTVLGWGPVGAERDSPVQLYGMQLSEAEAGALMEGQGIASLFCVRPVIRARALTRQELAS